VPEIISKQVGVSIWVKIYSPWLQMFSKLLPQEQECRFCYITICVSKNECNLLKRLVARRCWITRTNKKVEKMW